ncbi:Phospho-2-dehydro-3-deoxyheptonate aldolase, tyrosine-inhibited, putative [Perkinsus marinus ATCC 50983]|uniref:3-deoxy-7-phosphoheptulonate synthase n=1 Tax=Perkinsus marinus (strain ATCC 50983 / TXsc) TaxID=423536 RepID=C5KTM2_PERM5|nr:Phospho-2-dehydro-3-deoxyheptonate aldolase, tyrosine-inhibited, putative [Perkinsus marinus ATCC 50983]EER12201.1 Phospho-2-dehydro-3-deoxyheptonate aldolase, tyrosine-inhibited, putative [Perkinsus marinus ATCC 50983]|eukprot:XP_002780406.1 Phospho-2-dehydro-3-deoxyheptonate aldolase, tyrosine-inhibited, putative [Perkinsus marinus ATCC 50983]
MLQIARSRSTSPSRVEVACLPSAEELRDSIPSSSRGQEVVQRARDEASAIIQGDDDRLIVIVGPCSVHDVEAAKEYAGRLKVLSDRFRKDLLIIMRVYYEKPRSTVGWKGLLNDPYLDDTCQVLEGIRITRELLRDITDMGVPAASEFVEASTTQYFEDLVSWAAVGARTVESQPHRQLVSGLDLPVGFKNSTGGEVSVAVDAVVCSGEEHTYLAPSSKGSMCIVRSRGNKNTHVVLRGGRSGPNYQEDKVAKCVELLSCAGLDRRGIVIDCSHGNSNKDYLRQPLVMADICHQLTTNSDVASSIAGVMIESNLNEGSQSLPASLGRAVSIASESTDTSTPGSTRPSRVDDELGSVPELDTRASVLTRQKLGLKYGVSVTDGCVSWETTEHMLSELAIAVDKRRSNVA